MFSERPLRSYWVENVPVDSIDPDPDLDPILSKSVHSVLSYTDNKHI